MGYNRQPRSRDYWELEDTNEGITGSSFFGKVMSRNLWQAIDRCFQVDLNWIQNNFYQLSLKYWKLYENICFDESLVKWKGKGGYKQKILTKHCQTGQVIWNVCDEKLFTWCYAWQRDVAKFPEIKEDKKPISKYLVESFEQLLPETSHVIITDAGLLSNMKTIEYLCNKHRKTVMSLSINHAKVVIQELKENLELNQWNAFYGDLFVLLVWQAKSKLKFIPFNIKKQNVSIFYLISMLIQ